MAKDAFNSKLISGHFNLGGFVYEFKKIESVAAKIESNAVLAFSNYLWNIEYNKALSAAVKIKNPYCIFGGHQLAPGEDLLRERPVFDFPLYFGKASIYPLPYTFMLLTGRFRQHGRSLRKSMSGSGARRRRICLNFNSEQAGLT